MKCLILLVFCLIYTPLSENIPVSDQSSESSLTFTWTAPLHLQVRNNHGEMDEIQLRPANSIGSFQVDCLLDGYLLNDEEGSVAVSGCQNSTEVTIVIMSRYSSGSMFIFTPENNTTQEVRFPPSFFADYGIQELDEDSYIDNKKRSKRSYHPIDEIETYDEMFSGELDMPEALVFNFRTAYEDSFLTQMNRSRKDAEEYINRVTHLSKPYFTEKNLGVKIYLNVTQEIEYLQNKTFKIGALDLESTKAIEYAEPLSIYVFTNDRDTNAGVSLRKGACMDYGRLLNKWRSNITKAVITNVHELGHWFAMFHDHQEDKYNKFNIAKANINQITSYSPCNNTGVMTDISLPPQKWSECSQRRFEYFYGKNKDSCKFLNQDFCSADQVNLDACFCKGEKSGGASCSAGDYCNEDGTCQPEANTCTTDIGACIFPFTYKGKTYKECTKVNHNQAWCATKEDQTGNWWGNCPSTCKMHTSDTRVELRGGSTPSEGNVYALNSQNAFGPVCDDDWGDEDARVVCRQLGYSGGRSTRESHFGPVSSMFAMDDVKCNGKETQIQDCQHSTKDDCSGSEGAGVKCFAFSQISHQIGEIGSLLYHSSVRESAMGNFITDAMVWAWSNKTQGQGQFRLAIENSGGIKVSLDPGKINLKQLLTILPFQSTFDMVVLRGNVLKEALEHSVANCNPDGQQPCGGGFLQLSGDFRVVYNLSRPAYSRIVEAKVKCHGDSCGCEYCHIEDNIEYNVVMSDYIAGGADGYDMIKENAIQHIQGGLDTDIMKKYIELNSPVVKHTEGRISYGCCWRVRISSTGPAAQDHKERLGEYRVHGTGEEARVSYKHVNEEEFLYYKQFREPHGLWIAGPYKDTFMGGLSRIEGNGGCVDQDGGNGWNFARTRVQWEKDPQLKATCVWDQGS